MYELLTEPELYPARNPVSRQRNAYIRVFHAVPDAPAVDVYANDQPIARQLS